MLEKNGHPTHIDLSDKDTLNKLTGERIKKSNVPVQFPATEQDAIFDAINKPHTDLTSGKK